MHEVLTTLAPTSLRVYCQRARNKRASKRRQQHQNIENLDQTVAQNTPPFIAEPKVDPSTEVTSDDEASNFKLDEFLDDDIY
jgi:hypothetical protein